MFAIITAIALAASVPTPKQTEIAPKETAIVYEEQTPSYDLTDNKKRKK